MIIKGRETVIVGVFDALAWAELALCSCEVVSVMLVFLWRHNGPDVRGLGEGDAGCTP